MRIPPSEMDSKTAPTAIETTPSLRTMDVASRFGLRRGSKGECCSMTEIRVGAPALDMKAYLNDLVTLAAHKEPTLFSMRARVPTQGRADIILAATERM